MINVSATPHARRWAVAAALALGLFAATAQGVSAQPYGGPNLPPGVVSISLSGFNLDLGTTPTTTDPQPTISGVLQQSGGTVQIRITSTPQEFTAPVSATGAFSARVPEPLDNGTHSLYLNNALVGTFNVIASPSGTAPTPPISGASPTPPPSGGTPAVTPLPPSTGTGAGERAGGGGFPTLLVLAAVLAGGLTAGGVLVRAKRNGA